MALGFQGTGEPPHGEGRRGYQRGEGNAGSLVLTQAAEVREEVIGGEAKSGGGFGLGGGDELGRCFGEGGASTG